jgi:hypothetical protein
VKANTTVQRAASTAEVVSPARKGVLQRKCGCPGSSGSSAKSCDECEKKIQRKIEVGVSDDVFELEADRVAERALSDDALAFPVGISIRRLGSGGRTHGAAPPGIERVLAAGGQPMPMALRADMERRFGVDFGGVRLHTDADAGHSARDVNALAYTVGPHIAFAPGQFSPHSTAGKRLLAHELTHVVQQTSPGRVTADGARLLRKPAEKTEPEAEAVPVGRRLPAAVFDSQRRESVANVAVRENIQWNVPSTSDPTYLDQGFGPGLTFFFFKPYDPADKKWSAEELAGHALDVLQDSTLLEFKSADARQKLIDYIASAVRYQLGGFEGTYRNVIDVDGRSFPGLHMSLNVLWNGTDPFRTLFDDASWKAWTEFLRVEMPTRAAALGGLLIASANLGDRLGSKAPKAAAGKGGSERPAWTIEQEKALRQSIDDARKQDPKPELLPDKLVFYEYEGNWLLNVWVSFVGERAQHKAIRLKEGEKTDSLHARTIAAAYAAVDLQRARENKRREAEMPPWASALKTKLDAELGGKNGDDIPDGMTLVLEGRGARSRNGENIAEVDSSTPIEMQVLLRIWVFRGSKEAAKKYQGSVPLLPRTDPAELIANVRLLAAVLRQGEHIPHDVEFIPSEKLGEHMLPNFDAQILPLDLGDDDITVTGANNKFSLFLDFEKQYNAIGAHGLYVASKLYSQPIYYQWKVFAVPDGERTPERSGQSEAGWRARWAALYDKYNPGSYVLEGGDIRATRLAGTVPQPAAGFETGDDDITTRVRFNDEPGDYLVYCETRHGPIGDSKLKRVSSIAYYPVRTKTREQLAEPQITRVPTATSAVDRDILELRRQIAIEDGQKGALDPVGKKVANVALADALAQKSMLEEREQLDFVKGLDLQIKDGEARQGIARRLKKRLPEVLKQATALSEAGKEGGTPTELLAYESDLLALYLRLRASGKHVAGYERELDNELAELRKLRDRAKAFSDEFKSPSTGACVYTPEVVFLSKVDGRLYPLAVMVGESPTKHPSEKVAYTVADVTTTETKKRYRGASRSKGPDGHREAIDKAFEKLGGDGQYGDGWIAVRMPRGGPGVECAGRRRPEIKYYKSEKGILDKVLKVLGLLAMFLGIVALALTGFGAGAAGALLGVLAAGMGAAVAANNISERADRKTLAFDAELVMDVLAIVGLGEAIAAARLATLPRTMRGIQAYQRMGRFVALFSLGTGTASALLIPIQLVEDLNKIEALDLPPDVKREMIRQAWGNFAISVVTTGASFAHSRISSRMQKNALRAEEEFAAVREQAELVALEKSAPPSSLRDQGWIDAHGNWTDKAPEPIRRRAEELARIARGEEPPVAELPDAARKAVDKVNRGDVVVEGKSPGKRHADLDDGHEIVEVLEPGGGIACEYHSAKGPRVPCPGNMGSPIADTTPDPAPEMLGGVKPRKARRAPQVVDAPPVDTTARDTARHEVDALQAKVDANNLTIKANEGAEAAERAKVAKAWDDFTSTPHGNQDSPAGRENAAKKQRARKAAEKAERKLKEVESRVKQAREENAEHIERLIELDHILNPRPEGTGPIGSRAERESISAIVAGKTDAAPGGSNELKGTFIFKGSSQQPHDPKQAKPQGLDGGFENADPQNGPRHLAAEIKHEDTPLSPGQETHEWVDNRLDHAVGWLQAQRMRKEGFQYWVFRYRPGKKAVEATFLWEWRPSKSGKKRLDGSLEGTVHYAPR